MSFDVLGDVNWLAVIVAAAAYFALGGLWYGQPVFGRGYHVGLVIVGIILGAWM